MRPWMTLLVMLSACRSNSPKIGDGGGDHDGSIAEGGYDDSGRYDGSTMPDGQAAVCYGSFVRVCFPVAPMAPRMLGDTDINTDATDTSSLCDQTNDQKDSYCVVAGAGFMIPGGTLTAHGSKPLVLLSTTTFEVAGIIDVSSSLMGAQMKGPGADPAACMIGTAAKVNGGGYGGSFRGKGGNGSDGKPASGQMGGLAPAALSSFPSALRGGCPGGDGAPGAGTGGSGGGAIAIIAVQQINLNKHINASGAGGRGGQGAMSGGGGGGSGGMIVLDSPMIQQGVMAQIWANGGGGAQGGAQGAPGIDGRSSLDPEDAVTGTLNTPNGANGGNGSVGDTLSGSDGKADAKSGGGGGGGGGGAGFIRAPGVTGAAVISPPSN